MITRFAKRKALEKSATFLTQVSGVMIQITILAYIQGFESRLKAESNIVFDDLTINETKLRQNAS